MINAERIAICKIKTNSSRWRFVLLERRKPMPVETNEDIPRLDQIRKAIVNLEFCQEPLCAKDDKE
jgi:hypothetical protein